MIGRNGLGTLTRTSIKWPSEKPIYETFDTKDRRFEVKETIGVSESGVQVIILDQRHICLRSNWLMGLTMSGKKLLGKDKIPCRKRRSEEVESTEYTNFHNWLGGTSRVSQIVTQLTLGPIRTSNSREPIDSNENESCRSLRNDLMTIVEEWIKMTVVTKGGSGRGVSSVSLDESRD